MSRTTLTVTLRRAIVASGIVAGALLAGMSMNAAAQTTARAGAYPAGYSSEWLANLKGKHRQLFDAPAPGGGIALIHILNYYDTYNSAFGAADRDIDALLTFYGSTTFFGLSDEMWAKYKLGEFLGEKDASGQFATANPWRTAPVIIGQAMPKASIESLQKRGATFIVCNNALGIFAGLVAQARGLDQKAVYEDMKAHILPNVTLVPAMVIAIEQAQVAGLTYHRQ